ncbi:M24 family metallopeptidase [Oceanobacillus saliphilus]|uniref:M24 family metallopeptidase n=1 Tax=Oceanobacillus saliphilus TaxID=2925834 RepID=UPI00201E503A|nr:M24 family metallopeptidase [Oceanobacillus saliphilus]
MAAFDMMEYKDRIRKTKDKMAEKGMDVLLLTDPANMNYLTGYDSWSFYVHQLLIILPDEEEPFWIGRGLDLNGAKATTWLSETQIIGYPDDYVHSRENHPMDFVCRILKEIGQATGRIGIEMDSYYFTAKCYTQLYAGLPQAVFMDATNLVNYVRIIKSDKEIEYMKNAAKIVEKAMQTGIDAIEVGVRECDVVAEIMHAQISGTVEFGGDYPAIMPLLPSGKKTGAPHLTWTDEAYKSGEPVTLELAGCYKRYHSPLSRTVYLGEANPKVTYLADAVIEGLNATIDGIKPGMTGEEVEAIWSKSIAKSGFIKNTRIGYSMGLNYPPDWGEHTASLRPGDKTVLQPNMTFHVIPGIWLEEHGVEISESIRVTKNGCEVLADFPRKLFVKPSQKFFKISGLHENSDGKVLEMVNDDLHGGSTSVE